MDDNSASEGDANAGCRWRHAIKEQKYHVWNAPYTAVATGEDASDIIAKLRSVSYQKGHDAEVLVPAADTGDDTPGLATLLVLAAAAAGDAADCGAGGGAAAGGAPAAVKQKKRKDNFLSKMCNFRTLVN